MSSISVQLIFFNTIFFNLVFNFLSAILSLSIAIIVAPSLASKIEAALPIPFAAPVIAITFF